VKLGTSVSVINLDVSSPIENNCNVTKSPK